MTEESGNLMLGLHAIGDNDARVAAKYIRPREKQIKEVIEALDETKVN